MIGFLVRCFAVMHRALRYLVKLLIFTLIFCGSKCILSSTPLAIYRENVKSALILSSRAVPKSNTAVHFQNCTFWEEKNHGNAILVT